MLRPRRRPRRRGLLCCIRTCCAFVRHLDLPHDLVGNLCIWEGYALRCAPQQSLEWMVSVQRPPLFTEATMPSSGNTTQARVWARVIVLLFAVQLAGAASWRCSVNIEGDPSQVLVYTAASMSCFSDATGEQNLTVYADASLISYASSFTGEAF